MVWEVPFRLAVLRMFSMPIHKHLVTGLLRHVRRFRCAILDALLSVLMGRRLPYMTLIASVVSFHYCRSVYDGDRIKLFLTPILLSHHCIQNQSIIHIIFQSLWSDSALHLLFFCTTTFDSIGPLYSAYINLS